MDFFISFWQLFLGFSAILFGVGYNLLISWMEKRGYTESFTAYLVTFGVLITLALTLPFVGLNDVLIVLTFFALTGLPMIIGSSWRYLKKKEEGRRIMNDGK